MEAAQRLREGDKLAPFPSAVYDVILPRQAGLSTDYLAAAFRYHAERRGANVRLSLVERLDPQSLSDALARCGREGSDGVAFQALQDPKVREAVAHLAKLGVPVLSIVSDLSGMGLPFVGLDNRAAGRTAGYLMGLLCRGVGSVAVMWGGHLYRSHEEREFGFRSLLRMDFPDINLLDVTGTQDNAEEAFESLSKLLAEEPKLAGVYCVGGGIVGAVRALGQESGPRTRAIIGHNLTTKTRDFLLQRRMDVVIHQDMSVIADRALDYLLSGVEKQRSLTGEVSIQIITRENVSNHLNVDYLQKFLEQGDRDEYQLQ